MTILSALIGRLCGVMLLISLGACTMVGPDFVPPKADVSKKWVEAKEGRFKSGTPDYKNWWKIFNDPVLDNPVQTAYEQNVP